MAAPYFIQGLFQPSPPSPRHTSYITLDYREEGLYFLSVTNSMRDI
jgi:hypothetical protein